MTRVFVADVLMTLAGVIFVAALLPTVFSERSRVPVGTSLPTFVGMVMCVVASFLLGLGGATLVNSAIATAWLLIVLLRRC